MMIVTLCSAFFLILGVFFIALGIFGIFRFPDFFCRAHALSKAMTLGISLVFVAGWIYLGTELVHYKLLVAIVLQYTTIPLSGHILGLIAFRKNVPRFKHRPVDDHRIVQLSSRFDQVQK